MSIHIYQDWMRKLLPVKKYHVTAMVRNDHHFILYIYHGVTHIGHSPLWYMSKRNMLMIWCYASNSCV